MLPVPCHMRLVFVPKRFDRSTLFTGAILSIALAVASCTSPEPAPAPSATPLITVTATVALPTPSPAFTASPTDAPLPPTAMPPAPTFTPRPRPTPTRAPQPTYTPQPTSTPAPLSPIADLENGAWLERNRRARHDEISALPWIADGVDLDEREAAELLIACALRHPDTFRALLGKPWVADDSVTAGETRAIKYLYWMVRSAPERAARMLNLSWVQDDITTDEARAIKYLYGVVTSAPDSADRVMEFSWSRDNITAYEANVIKELFLVMRDAPTLAARMLNLSWVQDGISRDEAKVIDRMSSTIQAEDVSLQPEIIQKVIEILDMPFLYTVESPDALAMESLERYEDAGSAEFLELMAHPTLSDGINDEEAKIVVLLGAANEYKPESVPILLDDTSVYKEERAINLPWSGEVLLAIIRLRDHTNSNMDYLEHAVRHHEDFMGGPLPTNYVIWYFDDWTSSGAHYGTHITSNPKRDPPVGEYWRAPRHAAHEVAHYYWRDSRPWISEGGADMLAILSENARVGRPLEHNRDQCTLFNSISDLELAGGEKGSDGWDCNYWLGQRLFLDLYRTLGENTFQQAFRSLYLKRLRDDPTDDCEGTDLGICHLVAAFKADVSDEVAVQVDAIVARWYGPLP